MALDDRALHELTVESEDLQADALRDMKAVEPELRELGRERQGQPVDLDVIRDANAKRRTLLKGGGFGLGALAGRGLLATGIGSAIAAIVSAPAHADAAMDVQILQTASSLENLAVATYGAALKLPFISGQPVVKAFAMTTMKQHGAHADAFKSQTVTLGGKRQDAPDPKYAKVVNDAKPTLTDASKVVDLAMALETVATETYLNNLMLLDDVHTRSLFASVMGVESQHLATLRAVGALLSAGAVDLIAIPTDVAKLPKAAGSVAFPKPFEPTDMASPPEEGALK